MADADGYDVLRLIEHNQKCYISSEYARGRPLIWWLKYHPNITKEQLFLWIHEMARQLECIHRCRGQPCYQYVNPYSIIITETKELYFLDMSAESNEKMLHRMNRRCVRECFLPPEENYYQTASVQLDIYGLGKTIQYLISASEPDPPLKRREEARFQRIISKSLNRYSKRAYTEMSRFRKEIPIYKTVKKHEQTRWIKKIIIFIVILIFFTILIAGVIIPAHRRKTSADKSLEPHHEKQEVDTHISETEMSEYETELTELRKELGFCYFLELEDYEKSREYFESAGEDHAAKCMVALCEHMVRDNAGQEKELREILADIEEVMPQQEEEKYYRCLMKGYRLLGSKEDARSVVRIGKYLMKDGVSEEVKRENAGYIAAAYEQLEERAEAIEIYSDMLKWEEDDKTREELYKKLTLLWSQEEEQDKSFAICREGIEELKTSKELRMLYISMQCADTQIDRAVCAQTIQQYIREIPEITGEAEFQKLAQEYGIVVEGESVWVGR